MFLSKNRSFEHFVQFFESDEHSKHCSEQVRHLLVDSSPQNPDGHVSKQRNSNRNLELSHEVQVVELKKQEAQKPSHLLQTFSVLSSQYPDGQFSTHVLS